MTVGQRARRPKFRSPQLKELQGGTPFTQAAPRPTQPGHRDWPRELDVLRQRPGGKTAAVLLGFIAECGRAVCLVSDVLSRMATHPTSWIEELAPHA
jgi:hypothetical protein